jgi:hypothetical protein
MSGVGSHQRQLGTEKFLFLNMDDIKDDNSGSDEKIGKPAFNR